MDNTFRQSDLEDGEVPGSDTESLSLNVDNKICSTVIEVNTENRGDSSETSKNQANQQKKQKSKESSSKRIARKRKNRKIRREQEEPEVKKTKASLPTSKSYADELDEYEMLCVRGASPPPVLQQWTNSARTQDGELSTKEYDDDTTDSESDYYRATAEERRKIRRARDRRYKNRDRQAARKETDGICFKHYIGNCLDNQCNRSHEFRHVRKMELCKFFLTNMCAKTDHCTYMHSEFPCKFYYLGIPDHDQKTCPFLHGAPLSDDLQSALLNHIQKAPKSILGDFPSKYRINAATMLRIRHSELMDTLNNESNSGNNILDRSTKKNASRWSAPATAAISEDSTNKQSYASLNNLMGIITVEQIEKLAQIGVENVNQVEHLTVGQLNQIGLSINQIHRIQLNAMNIKKLNLEISAPMLQQNVNAVELTEQTLLTPKMPDLDLRILQAPIGNSNGSAILNIAATQPQDIDMRICSNIASVTHNFPAPVSTDIANPPIQILPKLGIEPQEDTAHPINYMNYTNENIRSDYATSGDDDTEGQLIINDDYVNSDEEDCNGF